MPITTAAVSSSAASFTDFNGEPPAVRMRAESPRISQQQPKPQGQLATLQSDAPRATPDAPQPESASGRDTAADADAVSAEARIDFEMRALNQELSHLGRGPRWREALDRFDALLLSGGPPPNAHVATTAIAIAGAHHDHRRAERIFSWFLNERQPPGRPTHQTYTALIQAYGRAGLWRSSLEVYESMGRAGVRPTKYTISAVVAACARGGEEGSAAVEELAAGLLGETGRPSALDAGVLDVAVLTSLISAFGRLRRDLLDPQIPHRAPIPHSHYGLATSSPARHASFASADETRIWSDN